MTTTTSTSSCPTCKTLLVGLLVIWGIVSMVVIAVWATHPELVGTYTCQKQLEDLRGVKVEWGKEKTALEEKVEEHKQKQTKQQELITALEARLALSNRDLEACNQEQVVLNGNITSLEQQLEEHKGREANLTAYISLQREEMEFLQENLTQASYQTAACLSLNAAAESQVQAAKSQVAGCLSGKNFLDTKLSKCKEVSSESKADSTSSTESSASSSSPVSMLTFTVCWGLLYVLSCSSSPSM